MASSLHSERGLATISARFAVSIAANGRGRSHISCKNASCPFSCSGVPGAESPAQVRPEHIAIPQIDLGLQRAGIHKSLEGGHLVGRCGPWTPESDAVDLVCETAGRAVFRTARRAAQLRRPASQTKFDQIKHLNKFLEINHCHAWRSLSKVTRPHIYTFMIYGTDHRSVAMHGDHILTRPSDGHTFMATAGVMMMRRAFIIARIITSII